MNNIQIFNKEFPNGWSVNVNHNQCGFGELYSTKYPYSVMTYKRDSGFTKFINIEKASDVFHYIAEVSKW